MPKSLACTDASVPDVPIADVSVGDAPLTSPQQSEGDNAASVRPTEPQRRYLERGLAEPGGKLPLFDRNGRAVPRKTVESCVTHGWAAPWFDNPLKPDWLVCRLTTAGYRALGREPPAR